MLSRRQVLTTPLALAATSAQAATTKMVLCMHQNSSLGIGYRQCLEGWARAGIKYAELAAQPLDDFLKTESVATATRVLSDAGLAAVSCGAGLADIVNPNPNRATALDALKRRCELFTQFGIGRIVTPARATQKITADDQARAADNLREAGDIARSYRMTLMPEFTRDSAYVSTLPTMLKMTRAAAHPNVRPMLDLYHFWAGLSKFEDLELVQPGEIAHVHFQDVPDLPRELLDNTTRAVPGEGVTPLARILRALAAKRYAGPLSVELFLFQKDDPYELATRVRRNGERVMRQAGVM
jgi:sugar phosphate isomerase/epimerase